MQAQAESAINAGSTTDPVITAVRGTFYRYRTEFTTARPLGFLMDCKANKGRHITDADRTAEHDLTFLFNGDVVAVCSPNARPSLELLGDLAVVGEINQTRIARTYLSMEAFNAVRDGKDGNALAAACRATITAVHSEDIVTLEQGMILAVITETGKYGLLHVTEVTPTSVAFDACHILLD